MAARSPARFLAPLALLAVVAALWMIVTHSPSGDSSGGPATTQQKPTATPGAKSASRKKGKRGTRFYTVKPGDTPSGIAEKTGVSLSRIEELNPDLDPQALSPGTKLKLRR